MIAYVNDIKLPKKRILSVNVVFDSGVMCATPVSKYLSTVKRILAAL